MKRVEIWFTSGLFRAFPHVIHQETAKDSKIMRLKFGGDAEGNGAHLAVIDCSKIDFFEVIDEEE